MNKREIQSLGVVIQKLDDMKESNGIEFRDIKNHLAKLNNKVYKNAKFRHIMTGALKIVGLIVGGGGIVMLIINYG